MTDGAKGGAQRARSLRPRCVGEVDPKTATHIYLSIYLSNQLILAEVSVDVCICYSIITPGRHMPEATVGDFGLKICL
jgi:hypothetical protein